MTAFTRIRYQGPCREFRKLLVGAIKTRNSYKIMSALMSGLSSYGYERFMDFLNIHVFINNPLKWDEITPEDSDFLRRFIREVKENQEKKRIKPQGFGSSDHSKKEMRK